MQRQQHAANDLVSASAGDETRGTVDMIEEYLGKIHIGDCLEFMLELEPDSVDLVFADTPFNAGLDYGEEFNDKRDWQEWAEWLELRIREMERIARGLVIIPCSVTGMLEFTARVRRPKWVAVWNKPMSFSHKISGTPWLPHWEPLMIFGNQKIGSSSSDVFSCNTAERNGHPCPKPEKLLSKIITQLECEIIFDPFLGSGTTAVVAERLGRRWLGCEINPQYAELAMKRINQEREKLQLFTA
jgi:site-specific DNA-methyltransferase (adenine-specific)